MKNWTEWKTGHPTDVVLNFRVLTIDSTELKKGVAIDPTYFNLTRIESNQPNAF